MYLNQEVCRRRRRMQFAWHFVRGVSLMLGARQRIPRGNLKASHRITPQLSQPGLNNQPATTLPQYAQLNVTCSIGASSGAA